MHIGVRALTATADPWRIGHAVPARLTLSPAELSGPELAGTWFLLVLAVGGLALSRRRDAVDRSVDDLLGRPAVAIVYGAVAYGLVLFVSLYASDILFRAGVAGTAFGYLVLGILVGGIVGLSGFGFVVVGTLLTDLRGRRAPRWGLLLGAVGSAVGWVALPWPAALGVCVVVGAFGVGGRTRTWLHDSRTVEAEVGAGSER